MRPPLEVNHAETGVTAVYDRHSYDAEKRPALDFWGKRVEPREQAGCEGADVPAAYVTPHLHGSSVVLRNIQHSLQTFA
ncbi:MAG: hypothetical protein WBD07_14120 [Vicinamibacterales bacterium]